MDKKIALHYIDEWANFYLRIFGEAEDLEIIEKEAYSILRLKNKEWAHIFDIRLEHLKDEELIRIVSEIKSMKKAIWWNQYSDRVNDIIFPEGRKEPTSDDDEIFAVMTQDEMPAYQDEIKKVRQAKTLEDFNIFYDICFEKAFNPNNYFDLFQKDMIRCYIGYKDETPVSVTAALKNGRIYSLEYTTTLDEHRRKGYAAAVCQKAIKEAFCEGAEVVTIRAGGGSSADENSKYLGKKLGFRYI